MSKIAEYLQEHIKGDVSTSVSMRRHFSHDASALGSLPEIIISPLDEQDVRKLTRFSWQLAERGKILPIVARGAGSDFGGAAIGQPIVLSTTQHLNKILEFDHKRGLVKVEPGANFGKLQHTLVFSHGCYIPAYPSSIEYSTIGGAIANNSGGERSLRSGTMSNFVESLRVVLANGDVIDTGRISKREASHKMGLSTFEGEIYRAIDGLISENQEAVSSYVVPSRGGAGFDLKSVRADNGSIDLTPLFVGSQGTLGVIVQAVLSTEKYSPGISSQVFVLKDREALTSLCKEALHDDALNLEFIDSSMLELARRNHKNFLSNELGEGLPAGVLVVEYPKMSARSLDKLAKKYYKKFADLSVNLVEQGKSLELAVKKLQNLPDVLLSNQFGPNRLVPGIDDAILPPDSIHKFLTDVELLFKKLNVTIAVHARPGEGIIHAYPLLDLSQLGDRQKLQRLTSDYYRLVLESHGSVVGEYGAGRVRGAFARQQLGDVVYNLMHRVKQVFDPYGILNPGVRIDVDSKTTAGLIRSDYDTPHIYTR